MSNLTTKARVACTFSGCRYSFKSPEEMKKHKWRFPDHDYCKRCDEDFADEEGFLIHKIRSTKHVACPICGEDFKSEGGRDTHIRQIHRADQDITCLGCRTKFTRAAALMTHIEDNQCSEITNAMYTEERAKKAVLKEAFISVLDADKPGGAEKAGSDVESDDGGVEVEPASLLDDPDSKRSEARNAVAGSNQKILPAVARSTVSRLSNKHWPTLGSERISQDQEEEDVGEDLMNFSELSIRRRGDEPGPWASKQLRGSNSREGSGIETTNMSRNPTSFDLDTQSDNLTTVSMASNKWDPKRFLNPVFGHYTCVCKITFATLKEFEAHLASGAHSQTSIVCPGCNRPFKTSASLVAHCETTSKCGVSGFADYAEIIADISGGVIEASGHHVDGSIKYEAGDIKDKNKAIENNPINPRAIQY